MSMNKLELGYKHPSQTLSGSIKYIHIQLENQSSLDLMFSIALPCPQLAELFVNVRNMMNVSLNLEVPSKCLDHSQCLVPELELVVPPMTNLDEDMDLTADNRFIDLKTTIDDEFDELDLEGEHDIYSQTFNDMVNNIAEHDSIFQPVAAKNEMLYKGFRCSDKETMQHIVKHFVVNNHHTYEVIESVPSKWVIRCKKWQDGCKWRLRAILNKSYDVWEITKYVDQHSCVYSEFNQSHSQLDSNMISRELCDAVRDNPSTSISTLQDLIKEKFGYHIPYRRVWEGKTKALARIFGDWDELDQCLPKWMYTVKHTNPRTIVEWKIRDYGKPGNGILHSVLWSFSPCNAAFQKFRPMIQIYGTHLYGKYKEKLLIATSVDSNEHLLPLPLPL
ncbi:uncharacterized protein LOC111023439 [Momordica charantia]|uniref:Uncharacterized protein LOC111023439 n=1 Tax=Momordica charantia TaxID=3673 RepID=A0A6J1DTV0_MOMCH|nr:uncharacterized protein LOC111023439 [Momordica charantia]